MPQRLVVTEMSHEPRKRFAEELRRLRTERGLSLRDLSRDVGWDPSLFGKMESSSTLGGPEVVQALDQFYGTGSFLLTLWELALGDPTQFKEQYRRYFLLQAEALSLWHYAATAPSGLLQVDGYVREALAAGSAKGEELEQQIEARVSRRKLLEGRTRPVPRHHLRSGVAHGAARQAGVAGAVGVPGGGR